MGQYNRRNARDMSILGGWLFADLVVALMIIFLAAQSAFPKPVPEKPTPTLTPTLAPTPTPVPRLDFNPLRFELDDVDYQGVLNNTPAAVQHIEQFIDSRSTLQNRVSGLVIIYDGALNDSDIPTAQSVVNAIINNVLKSMGRRELLFKYASYYSPLFRLGDDHNIVIFDIYLFQQQ